MTGRAPTSPDTVSSPSWDGPTPEIAVLIPTHDRSAFLRDLLVSLERQTLGIDRFEVVIVDDASADGTWTLLQEISRTTPLRLRAVRASENRGPAAARNVAASHARAALFAFTDDDCLPTPVWLEALLPALRSGDDLVQGRTLPSPTESRGAGPWARSVWITGPTDLYETCNLGWRREAFERLGGFALARVGVPGATRPHFGEDAELGWRLIRDGGRASFCAGALVHHRVYRASYRDWLREQRRLSLFPGLVGRTPGLGRALRLGVFLSWRTAAFDLMLAGAAAGAITRRPWWLLSALPWVRARWRDAAARSGRRRAVRVAQLAIGDAVGLASLLEGSVRSGRPVL